MQVSRLRSTDAADRKSPDCKNSAEQKDFVGQVPGGANE
jgi:hypothetical protein